MCILDIPTIKMTSRLSYCMWFTTLIILDFVLSTSLPISNGSTDFKESRLFKRNASDSRNGNKLKNSKNSAQVLIMEEKNSRGIRRDKNKITKIANSKEEKEFEEWNAKMQKVTRQQLEKWNCRKPNNYNKNKIKSNIDNHRSNSYYDEEINTNDKLRNSSNIILQLKNVESTNEKNDTKIEVDFNKSLEKKKLLEWKYQTPSESTSSDGLTDRIKYPTGRRGMMENSPPEFSKEISDGGDRKNAENIKVKSKFGKDIICNRYNKTKGKNVSKFFRNTINNAATSLNKLLKKNVIDKKPKKRKHFNNSALTKHKVKLLKDLSVHSTRRNLQGYSNEVDKLAIKTSDQNARLCERIFILSPVIWMFQTPTDIKQQLGVLPDELINPSRDIHFINSSIILGQISSGRIVENNKEDEGNNDDSMNNNY